jgi:hypothetical protein
MLRYYTTAQTRDMLIAESKRLLEERARKRREKHRRDPPALRVVAGTAVRKAHAA